jgi:hypothetical protein
MNKKLLDDINKIDDYLCENCGDINIHEAMIQIREKLTEHLEQVRLTKNEFRFK